MFLVFYDGECGWEDVGEFETWQEVEDCIRDRDVLPLVGNFRVVQASAQSLVCASVLVGPPIGMDSKLPGIAPASLVQEQKVKKRKKGKQKEVYLDHSQPLEFRPGWTKRVLKE